MLTSDVLNVTVGEGQWSDKIGAGAIGWFVAWPLAFTALFGAYRQKNLPMEIFGSIERSIMLEGKQIVINGSGDRIQEGMVVCPSCKTQNTADSKFCMNCGTPLSNKCPNCGKELAPGSKFCSECGQKL